MKKTIFTLLLLFLLAGAFAENGYAGKKWGDSSLLFDVAVPVKPGDDVLWETTKAEKKTILGKETIVYYHFFDDTLMAVSYTLPLEKTETLKKKFKDLVFNANTVTVSQRYYLNELLNDGTLKQINDEDLDLNYVFAYGSLSIEFHGYDSLKGITVDKGAATISLYDYNDDTRVCIWENIVNGKTFVVYTYHRQDY